MYSFCVKKTPDSDDIYKVHLCPDCPHCSFGGISCCEQDKNLREKRINLGHHKHCVLAVQHAKEHLDGEVRMCEECEKRCKDKGIPL